MHTKTFALFGLASAASAHMIMANPKPFGSPNNSPLDASGSDFPCKGLSPDGSSNKFKAGSTQELSFTGSAVHGGGSCQVSITTDKNPTKDSTWKVIKSIEGGCPAKNAAGNIGASPDSSDPFKYDFEIPKEMADGEYVLAWTWFNKIGNREMYMNCASVDISGGKGDKSYLDSLPDMFVANVGNQCTSPDSKDLVFPDPGKSVDKFNGQTQAWGNPQGEGCAAKTGGGGGSSPTGGDSAPEPTTAPTSPPSDPEPAPTAPASSPADPAPTPTPSVPGGVFQTVPTAAPSPEPQPGNGGDGNSGGSGKENEAGSPCSTEGSWNCIGGTKFQRCASGAWSEPMAVAAGMTCEGGQSSELKVHAGRRGKRDMRHAQRAWA